MDVYGLTGGIGSGKSSVAALLEGYGIPVVSADELSRMVVAPGSAGLDEVVGAFGRDLLDERGELDRRKMARIIFSDAEKRKRLEAILHPLIRERFGEVLDALEKAGHRLAFYEVPLLFEKNLQGDMRGVLLVTADDEIRIARVIARDGTTPDEVRARMRAQMPEDEKRRRATLVIENDGDYDALRQSVERALRKLLGHPASLSTGASPSAPPATTPRSRAVTQTGVPATSPPPSAAGTADADIEIDVRARGSIDMANALTTDSHARASETPTLPPPTQAPASTTADRSAAVLSAGRESSRAPATPAVASSPTSPSAAPSATPTSPPRTAPRPAMSAPSTVPTLPPRTVPPTAFPTATQSTATQSTATQSTAAPTTATQSTATQTSAAPTTATQSTATPTTATQTTAAPTTPAPPAAGAPPVPASPPLPPRDRKGGAT